MEPWNTGVSAEDLPQWNPLIWDGISQFYPWRVFYSRSITQGIIPLWNPHQFCGTPFAANAQTAIFYPPNLIFVLFTPVRAFGLSAALHLFLAGLFTFLLARALGLNRLGATTAGVIFVFSAFMVVWMELPTFINVAMWLPIVFYLILYSMDRFGVVHAILAGLAMGAAILAGHFQVASYVVGAAVFWWVWLIVGRARVDGRSAIKRGTLLALLSFIVAILVASPQVLPTLELAGMSHRVRDITAEGYTTYVSNAVPTRNLITLFVPNFYGNPSNPGYPFWAGSAANFMEYALYIGLMPLLLAIFGTLFAFRWRGTAFFVTLGVLSLLLAFGTPLNYITYYLLPGTSALGGPNRIILLFCFSAAMLAGFGAHWFIQMARENYRATERKQGWRALTVGGAVFAILFIAGQAIASHSLPSLVDNPSVVFDLTLGQYLSLASVIAASIVVLALYTSGHISRSLFSVLALVVIVSDLFSFGIGFNPTSPPEKVYPESKLTRWLKDNTGSARLMPINNDWSLYEYPQAVLPPNAATVYGLNDMQGYDSLFSRKYKQFIDSYLDMDSSPRENGNLLFIRSYVTGWPQGTSGYVLSREPLSDPALAHVFEADGVHVYRQRAYNPQQDAYLLRPDQQDNGNARDKPAGRAWIVYQSANEVTVSTNADSAARLVLTQAYYPGWRVRVDRIEQPVKIAQGIFRSAQVEAGASAVRFEFRPGVYVLGMFLGLLGALAMGVALGITAAGGGRR